MIVIGYQLQSQVLCPTCGKPLSNNLHPNSAFIFGFCSNQDCADKGIGLLIERSTMMVVNISTVSHELLGKRVYPVMADEEGNQVWPETKK